jgi:hypothetical protein
MTLTIELTPELEARLKAQAQASGKPLSEYVRSTLEELAAPREVDMEAFLALPRQEQDRLLAAAAESAAPLYEADLELPPHERELTAFTALDGEPYYEYPEEEMEAHAGPKQR